MKKIVISALITVAICSGWIFSYRLNLSSKDAIAKWSDLTDILRGNISDLEGKNLELVNSSKTIEDELTKEIDLNKTLTADKTKIAGDLGIAKADLAISKSAYTTLKDSIMCKDAADYTFNMKSNSSVMESLKEYAGDKAGTIVSSDWKTIWSDSKAAIHYLRGEFMMVFAVSFKDKYMADYIYDLQYHCFLIAP
ncbi:MAG: hypothetical protein C0391_03750 [Anaerolinea sp.]|nr:hypothetical protein [Anaerolinea sp.]